MQSDHSLNPWRAYRLIPKRGPEEAAVLQLEAVTSLRSGITLLPNADNISYILVPAKAGPLRFSSTDLDIEALGVIGSLVAYLRSLFILKRKKVLIYPDFKIFASGPKSARKVFLRTNKQMLKTGLAFDGPTLVKHPEVLIGWDLYGPAPKTNPEPLPASAKIAIVVHIYYPDTWPEMAAVLRQQRYAFDLFVTTIPGRTVLIDEIRAAFPQADVRTMENRGRDVRPFLVLLEEGAFDSYDFVCKIHGKKSNDGGRATVMGALWRRRMLFDLLAAPNAVRKIIDRFSTQSSIGMIGPRVYRYPSKLCSEKLSWGENRTRVLELAERMGIPADRFRLDFFCGTMFWVRPAALIPLRKLALAATFPAEQGKIDGALEHAVERLFPTSALAAGYEIDDTDAATAIGIGA